MLSFEVLDDVRKTPLGPRPGARLCVMCVCVSERESVVSENKNSPRKVSWAVKHHESGEYRKKNKLDRSTHELYHTTATSSRLRGLARFARCAPFGSREELIFNVELI